MQINPPTLFWMAIAAILAADRFLPLARFEQPGSRGAVLVILGVALSAAGKKRFRMGRREVVRSR